MKDAPPERPEKPKVSFDRSGRPAVAEVFRRKIEAQLAEGAKPDDLTLRLTNGDAHRLKRDPAVPMKDIAFKDGVMRFLGVKVVEGGVDVSTLDLDEG
ncbi:hypothetical protein [Phenylobacterium sp.]|jgi:hypothetical protein|uniref:hypothetical protein n=1 Tax=Phenylobacterium sp. TaxID=1871053 RepID=UPI002F934509